MGKITRTGLPNCSAEAFSSPAISLYHPSLLPPRGLSPPNAAKPLCALSSGGRGLALGHRKFPKGLYQKKKCFKTTAFPSVRCLSFTTFIRCIYLSVRHRRLDCDSAKRISRQIRTILTAALYLWRCFPLAAFYSVVGAPQQISSTVCSFEQGLAHPFAA